MTRIGFSVLGAAGFAAVLSFGSSFTTSAEAAVLRHCKGNAFNTAVTCCESIKRKPMIVLNFGNINCSRAVECTPKKGKKSCYVRVTQREPNEPHDTPKTRDTPKTHDTPNDRDTTVKD